MTMGTITNTISKASSTKADRANTTSTVMAAPVAPPGTRLDPAVEQAVGAEGAEQQGEGGGGDEQGEQRAAHRHGVAQHGAESAAAQAAAQRGRSSSSAVPPMAAASTA